MRGVGTLLVLGLLAAPGGLFGQSAEQSAGGLPGLSLPIGARLIGQGRTVVARQAELQGAPYNPAAIFGYEQGAVTFSRFEGADDADVNSSFVAAAYAASWGTVGFQFVFQDFGEILVTETSPVPVGRIDISDLVFGVTYANAWRERLVYGVTAKVISSDLGVVDASGAALDVGIVYSPQVTVPFRIGVSLRNLGPDLSFDDQDQELPGRLRVGFSAEPTESLGLPPGYAVEFAVDVEADVREPGNTDLFAGGALTVMDVVVVRAGAVVLDNPFVDDGDDAKLVGGTFGIGVQYGNFQADIAREVSLSELGDETHFGVGWVF